MTMDIERADIVISLNGRDAGKRFYVLDVRDGYALLCDGKTRRVEKPKRKKLRHLRFDSTDSSRIAMKIRNGEKVNNSEIRRSLAEILSAAVEKGGM